MDFSIKKINNYEILVIDDTRIILPLKYNTISSIKMDIESAVIDGGIISNIDVMNYIRKERKEREMFKITSSVLGMGESKRIPDGVYKITLKYNNNEIVTNYILVVTNIKEHLTELAENSSNASISNTGVVYNDPNSVEEMSKVNYAFMLYFQLLSKAQEWNIVDINDLIDKLKRLLLIIR